MTRKPTYSLKRTDLLSRHRRDPRYDTLNVVMAAISQKGNQSTLNFWVSVEAEIRRFGLARSLSAATVLNESYMRCVKAIDRGRVIHNYSAWLRLTCRYIVKEKKRHQQRDVQFDLLESILFDDDDSEASSQTHGDCDKTQLKRGWKQLTPLDQTIIELNVIQGLSWQKVQQSLQENGLGTFSLPALRKRKQRALERLKQFLSDAA